MREVGAGVVSEDGGDVLERRVPAHQLGGVGGRSAQRQGVMLVQPTEHVQDVSAGTVHAVRSLAAGDQRTHVLVVHLQEPAHRTHTKEVIYSMLDEFSRRRLLPAVSPAAGHLTTPTLAGLPGLCENFRPTTSKSRPILRLMSSYWATSVVRTRVVGVANVGDSLRRLSSLQHRIYNLLDTHSSGGVVIRYVLPVLWMSSLCAHKPRVVRRRRQAEAQSSRSLALGYKLCALTPLIRTHGTTFRALK